MMFVYNKYKNLTLFLILSLILLTSFSCGYNKDVLTKFHRNASITPKFTTSYTLNYNDNLYVGNNITWSTFSIVPLEKSVSQSTISKVKPKVTKWFNGNDHKLIVQELDKILISNKIESENVRVRMIAHAIVASGWKQNIWNYNAWGVKKGEWQGNYYVMPTVEEDQNGNDIIVDKEQWRAFSNWQDSIYDFNKRISADSNRPSYKLAHSYLTSNKIKMTTSASYWNSLGRGNYYTATKFTGKKFASLCAQVRTYLVQ